MPHVGKVLRSLLNGGRMVPVRTIANLFHRLCNVIMWLLVKRLSITQDGELLIGMDTEVLTECGDVSLRHISLTVTT